MFFFTECFLTLDKSFTECKMAFAECLRHSAKNTILVVFVVVVLSLL
jgi:hypothetical protein